MAAIQIRDVPEPVRARLAQLARERGQSLQSYLLDLVSDEVRRQDNLAVLCRFGEGRHGTRLTREDVVSPLHEARAARDESIRDESPE
ncbi:FitA-like ribbon-helix-helix domain-containing protein [Amycolatopsis pithecellobii]|uniref:Antitoxin FitA-like ribbon-helix-helix domain-containing protein n=1 Tax=Amycolatopsis pithecellobii TaxID=664692 RepID=A0A6N7YVK1_9PSEU|nr:hypothetical protein [Amycolatopsis pithecellobii]MTD57095.1 hypothetical protein [Amycolatopsis pithecellobii]